MVWRSSSFADMTRHFEDRGQCSHRRHVEQFNLAALRQSRRFIRSLAAQVLQD